MKITDFEDDFDDKVLTRGYAYYKDGAILSVEPSEDNENEYLAEVEGSEMYNVCVEITPSGEIAFAACNCPYDYGYCKHIAAVLYHIRDLKKRKKKLPKTTEKLSDLIGKCSKKQLEEIIIEHANKDKSFKNYLKMILSESNDINKYIFDFKRIAHRFFSGDNCDIDELCKSADILIAKAEKRNSAAEIINACASIISIFEKEMADSYIDSDEVWDFNCELEICANRINTTAQAVIESGNKNLIAEIWSLLINNWVGDDEYWGKDIIFPTLMEFAVIPEYRQKLEEKLINMKINASEYTAACIDKKLYKIVESYGAKEDTDKFIYDHISDPYFRSMAIENAILTQDYTEAEQLALDGESADSKYDGLVHQWMKKRHDIYMLNGDKIKLEEICRQLILMGDDEYYKEWKVLVPDCELQSSITKLLNTTPNYSYEYIVIQENLSDRIYDLCCKRASKITEYYTKLKGTEFEEKGLALYEKYLRNYISQASTRSAYQSFCRLLTNYAYTCGKKEAMLLADDLRNEYCRRPAFIDELNRAGF